MSKCYFWDSNIFIAYINKEQAYQKYLDDISKILNDPKSMIFSSQLALSEVTPNKIKESDMKSLKDFIDSFRQRIILINPTPNIWINAGLLKDVQYKKNNSENRVLSTGDALMLATALELQLSPFNLELDAFHTFDDGKGKNSERKGKCIPLLSYQEWIKDSDPSELVKKVIELNRCKPKKHSDPLF